MADASAIAVAGLALMAASEVPNFLAGLLPSTMTIGRFAAEPADRLRLRRSEIVGSGLAVGTGVGAALIANHPAPFIMVLIVLAIMLYEYERAIRTAMLPGSGAVPINLQPGWGA